jgi:hypothetical protein
MDLKGCTLIYLALFFNAYHPIPTGNIVTWSRQVFWLPDSPTKRAFPYLIGTVAGCAVRPRLQRQVRSRFQRDSLLSLVAPKPPVLLGEIVESVKNDLGNLPIICPGKVPG